MKKTKNGSIYQISDEEYSKMMSQMFDAKARMWKNRVKTEDEQKPEGEPKYYPAIKVMKSLVCAARKVICGEKIQKNSFEENCRIVHYIVTEIVEMDADTFYKIYNTQTLQQLKLKGIVNQIIRNAPENIRFYCGYNNKCILFASVFPEFYKTHFKALDSREIYFCSGDLKSSLKRASAMKLNAVHNGDNKEEYTQTGNFKKERTITTAGLYGNDIDMIMYKAIDDMLNQIGLNDFPDKLQFLAEVKDFYASKHHNMPGIYSVIDARGCYASYLDFFMLNAPAELQEEYIFDYIAIRQETQGEDEFLNTLFEVYKEEILDQ